MVLTCIEPNSTWNTDDTYPDRSKATDNVRAVSAQGGNPAAMEIDEHTRSTSAITTNSGNPGGSSIQDILPTGDGNPVGIEVEKHIPRTSATTAGSRNLGSISIQHIIVNHSTSPDTPTVDEEGSCDSIVGNSTLRQDGLTHIAPNTTGDTCDTSPDRGESRDNMDMIIRPHGIYPKTMWR